MKYIISMSSDLVSSHEKCYLVKLQHHTCIGLNNPYIFNSVRTARKSLSKFINKKVWQNIKIEVLNEQL